MAVTTFDGRFSFKQDTVARLGDRANTGSKMNAEQREKFNNSPFMQGVQKTEQLCWEFTCSRDQKRAKLDPTFKPSDNDFSAPKAHEYDKQINYYKVLGIDEYSIMDDVKKAYKKLSLIYHPDKSAGLSDQEKEANQQIFIELKSAYQTLSDNPTRRQYDRDRDRDKASGELGGHKRKEKVAFNAQEVMNALAKKAKPAGKLVNVPVAVKLEKFFYGGHKAITRDRKVEDRFGGTFYTQKTQYRLDVPKGGQEPHEIMFKGRGDHNETTRPDSLNFQVKSKTHERLLRQGNDLEVKRKLPLGQGVHAEPYITAQTMSVNGRLIVLWGRNPFYGSGGKGSATLQVRLKGEGLTAESFLRFTCLSSLEAVPEAMETAIKKDATSGTGGEEKVVVLLKNMMNDAKVFVSVPPSATLGLVRQKAAAILGLKGNKASGMRLLKKLPNGQGFTPYPDNEKIGTLRELPLAGVSFEPLSFKNEKGVEFLQALVKHVEGAAFQAGWQQVKEEAERGERVAAQARLNAMWKDVSWILTDYGMDPSMLDHYTRVALAETRFVTTVFVKKVREQAEGLSKYSTLPNVTVEKPVESTGAETPGSKVRARTGASGNARGLKRFLGRYGLGPPDGFEQESDPEEDIIHGQGRHCSAPSIQRRIRKRDQQNLYCELELSPMGEAISLFTRPTCSIAFYSNAQQSATTPAGQVKPRPVFAFVLCSPVCAKKKAQKEWTMLQQQLLPVVQATVFQMLRAARRILPRPLANVPAHGATGSEQCQTKAGEAEGPKVPCKRLADEAFKRGDNFTAMTLYTKCLEEAEADAEKALMRTLQGDGEGDASDANIAAATALSNRAACLARVKDFQASLADARLALEKRPKWGKAWGRAALAASWMGKGFEKEALDCYKKCVEFDPSASNVEALFKIAEKVLPGGVDAAHPEKENGNQALRINEVGLAVACYTIAIALLPKEEYARGEGGKMEKKPDEHALFRAVLFANRCGAFCRLKAWQLAVADGQKAVAAKGDFAQAHNKLGAAYLGSGLTEKAYAEFSRGLHLEGTNKAALAGRKACLGMLPLWKSAAAKKRKKRFAIDLMRPKGSTKVYAISDVFFDHKYNEDWAHSIDDFKFSEDVLIVAGNLCDTRNALARALVTLKHKFRRVFYVPGNHEMYVATESDKYSDSIAKLLAIYELCDELDVDIFPAAVCEGVFIVPLLSWYSADFDLRDPFPDFTDNTDQHCRWPIDKDAQVWKYMLKLNEPHLRHLYHGTVITFSHFLPNQRLVPPVGSGKARKTMGCEAIEEQIKAVGSKVHVFGHTRRHTWIKDDDVTTYINHYHGLDDEHEAFSPLLCIYNGSNIRKTEVDICDPSLMTA